jgi:hypothetical protein
MHEVEQILEFRMGSAPAQPGEDKLFAEPNLPADPVNVYGSPEYL